jgi:hypothetical protein
LTQDQPKIGLHVAHLETHAPVLAIVDALGLFAASISLRSATASSRPWIIMIVGCFACWGL